MDNNQLNSTKQHELNHERAPHISAPFKPNPAITQPHAAQLSSSLPSPIIPPPEQQPMLPDKVARAPFFVSTDQNPQPPPQPQSIAAHQATKRPKVSDQDIQPTPQPMPAPIIFDMAKSIQSSPSASLHAPSPLVQYTSSASPYDSIPVVHASLHGSPSVVEQQGYPGSIAAYHGHTIHQHSLSGTTSTPTATGAAAASCGGGGALQTAMTSPPLPQRSYATPAVHAAAVIQGTLPHHGPSSRTMLPASTTSSTHGAAPTDSAPVPSTSFPLFSSPPTGATLASTTKPSAQWTEWAHHQQAVQQQQLGYQYQQQQQQQAAAYAASTTPRAPMTLPSHAHGPEEAHSTYATAVHGNVHGGGGGGGIEQQQQSQQHHSQASFQYGHTLHQPPFLYHRQQQSQQYGGGAKTTYPSPALLQYHHLLQPQQQSQQQQPQQQQYAQHRSAKNRASAHQADSDNAIKKRRAIELNKRITSAYQAKDILDTVNYNIQDFDGVALATAVHRLASFIGKPNMHERITTSPEFFKLITSIKQRIRELSMRNIANVVWGLAKLSYTPSEDVLITICNEIRVKADQGIAQNIANTIWALGALHYKPEEETLAVLADAVRDKMKDFTPQHISNIILAFAKLEFALESDILESLGQEALAKLDGFTAQALSNTLWGLSKLGISNGQLFLSVAQGSLSKLSSFNAQNLSNSVWAYGNIGVNPGEEVLDEYALHIIQKIDEFAPQNLSNVVWAYAKLGYYHSTLFMTACSKALQTMHTFTPQSVANFIWAYATLEQSPPAVFLSNAVSHSIPRLKQWAPQNLSNVAWSLAVLKDHLVVKSILPTFFAAIMQEISERVVDGEREKDFSRQHLANYLWSMAVLNRNPGPNDLRMLCSSLVARKAMCNPQELSTVIWSCQKLDFYDGMMLDEFANEAVSRLESFDTVNLSTMIYAYAKIGHFHLDLMTAAASISIDLIQEYNLGQLTQLAWSYSVLNIVIRHFADALLSELSHRLESSPTASDLDSIPLMIWSLATLDILNKSLWNLALLLLRQDCDEQYESLLDSQANQIFQAWMIMVARHPERREEWYFDEKLKQRGLHAWKTAVQEVIISDFHKEVSRMLFSMGIRHKVEYLTEDGLFSIDVALPDERIALEVDGPHHFIKNTLKPFGDTIMRWTLLESVGWKVKSIPFFSWYGVEEESRRTFLSGLLNDAREMVSEMDGD